MSGVRDIDHGYQALLRGLGRVASRAPRVLVGILQDKGAERTPEGDITLAGYAAVNEFGSKDGHVPERSFLRSTVDEKRADYSKALERAVGSLVDGARDSGAEAGLQAMEQKLGQLGARAARDVKRKIRDIHDPPNAPSTLAQKYPGNEPLIHTGRMRQSISFQVDMTGTAEGTTSTPTAAKQASA